MKILVTGATGFVGSHLVDLLEKNGHELYCLVRSPAKAQEFKIKGRLIEGSLSSHQENPWVASLPEDLEAVVHTAGIVHSTNTDDFYKVNTHCTLQLGNDLIGRYPKLKFILISSLAAAGASENEITEDRTEDPLSEYGKSKLAAEQIVKDHLPKDWEKTIIRPPMVIGPRDPAVLDVFKMVKSGFVPGVGLGAGEKSYSFVCVFDLIRTIELALQTTSLETQVYFSSYPKAIRFNSLLASIASHLERKKPFIVPLPTGMVQLVSKIIPKLAPKARLTEDKLKEIIPKAWHCCSEKSIKDLGQSYEWNLDRTIEVTLKDYQSRGWL
ncbi:MAG: nucleoside-diphosphate-sugar epimerase [Bacteriovoracaceae bacterium]|jgi:nucleoside-diphosphate-sugar epimerase